MAISESNKVIGKCSFSGGVHPPDRKKCTRRIACKRITLPAGSMVVVPMSQHIGAPCQPTVEKKQEITAGEVIGSADAFVSAPVHSPVNGVVKDVSLQPHPSGRKVQSVVITVGEEQPAPADWTECPADFDPNQYEPSAICQMVRDAGVVGMGGAAFPTAVKLTANPQKPVETLVVNGCECEPYLTSDNRVMIEAPDTVVAGVRLAMRAVGAKNAFIGIEDNKPDCIDSMLNAVRDVPDIQLAICETRYPQGGEKQLIKAILNREVPTGGLPSDVKVGVVNVGTAAAMLWACYEKRPLIERIVTVTGAGIKEPGNFRVPVGMLLGDLLEQCGGLTDDAEKVLLGGPMMGPTAARLDVPILKGTSGITVMTKADVRKIEATACIRCSRCVDVCPLKLVPTRIAHAVKARDIEMAKEYDLAACCECGCCTYVCPAQIPLLQYLRSGKVLARK